MSTGQHVATKLLVDGFAAAVARVGAVSLPDAVGFHAMFEALAWAGAIRDRFTQEGTTVPPAVLALWYVRNLAMHQGADVVWRVTTYGSGTFGEGVFGGLGFGGGVGSAETYLFPPRAELPTGKSNVGAAEYDALMAGTEVIDGLALAVNQATGVQTDAEGGGGAR